MRIRMLKENIKILKDILTSLVDLMVVKGVITQTELRIELKKK